MSDSGIVGDGIVGVMVVGRLGIYVPLVGLEIEVELGEVLAGVRARDPMNTPYGIMVDAAQDAGILQDGDELTSEQIAKYLRRLNDIVNFEQTQGIKLFLQTDHAVPLTAGKQAYTINLGGYKPLRVLQGYILQKGGVRRPIYGLSWNEWLTLSDVSQTGAISQYFVDVQTNAMIVHFWLIPDMVEATNTAHLLIQRQIVQPVTLVEQTEFPIEWRMFLRWALAKEMSVGQPPQVIAMCEKNAETYRLALEAWDVEQVSTTFQVDSRGGMLSTFR